MGVKLECIHDYPEGSLAAQLHARNCLHRGELHPEIIRWGINVRGEHFKAVVFPDVNGFGLVTPQDRVVDRKLGDEPITLVHDHGRVRLVPILSLEEMDEMVTENLTAFIEGRNVPYKIRK